MPRSRQPGPLFAATAAAHDGEELALLHVEAPCPVHLPFVLHRDGRMPRAQEAQERLKTGAAQRLAVGAGAAGGGEFGDGGHGPSAQGLIPPPLMRAIRLLECET